MMADVYAEYKGSDLYQSLTKQQRRKMNERNFRKELRGNMSLKMFCSSLKVDTERRIRGGVKRLRRPFVWGWRSKDDVADEDSGADAEG